MLSLIALKVKLLAFDRIAFDCPLQKSEIEKIAGINGESKNVSTETGDGSDERREIILNRLMEFWNQYKKISSRYFDNINVDVSLRRCRNVCTVERTR